MARQPEVFVRDLDPAEAQRLVKITRTARDRVRLRRAGTVLASVQGRTATEGRRRHHPGGLSPIWNGDERKHR
ncbi:MULTISPECIES: hypothetical protein [unclassified Pseudonocardia]|uniref:hypothetical protein n=1 Tax=unclassified Pseudonocardia TaxID=2619320 RepID=UPI000AA568F7|nr:MULTISPECIES: hypothetical protein [unclassified Pseudonocardia]